MLGESNDVHNGSNKMITTRVDLESGKCCREYCRWPEQCNGAVQIILTEIIK